MRDYLWCMSLLEWLKFWSKFSENTPILYLVQNTPPPWKLSESPNPRGTEYPPMKIVRESKSERYRIPPNENCQRVQIREVQNTPPMKIVRVQIREVQNTPPNENCQRVQIREVQNTPLPPQNENCQRVQIQEVQNTPPPQKNRNNFRFQTSE